MNPGTASQLESQIAPFTHDAAIQKLLADAATDAKCAMPCGQAALHVMAGATPQPVPADWLQAVTGILRVSQAGPNSDLLQAGLAAARSFSLAKATNAELVGVLRQIGKEASLPAETRLAALAAAGKLENVPANLLDFLLASVASTNAWAVRNGAAKTPAAQNWIRTNCSLYPRRSGPLAQPNCRNCWARSKAVMTKALG